MEEPTEIHAGLTATQLGATERQLATLAVELAAAAVSVLHHGDCKGGDEQGCRVARSLGIRLVCHPPTDEKKRAFVISDEYREPLPYLDRDTEIAREGSVLFAMPRGYAEVRRSGTWATVRRARKLGRPVVIIWPDGTVSRT